MTDLKLPDINQGESKELDVTLHNDQTKDPLDLTLATEITCLFTQQNGAFITKKKTEGVLEVEVVSATLGKFKVKLLKADTKLLKIDLRQTLFVVVDFGANPEDKREIIDIPDSYNVIESKFKDLI